MVVVKIWGKPDGITGSRKQKDSNFPRGNSEKIEGSPCEKFEEVIKSHAIL